MARIHIGGAALIAAAGALSAARAHAQEYSIIHDCTVIGQNTGYATGTPRPDLPDNKVGRTPVEKLEFIAEAAVFLKNLELDGYPAAKKIEGETFIGFLAPVRLRYRAHQDVTIEGGAVLGHNFGDDDSLDNVDAIVRLVYEPFENVYVIAGTILPTHWIHDALHDDVNKFRNGAEQGFQVRVDQEHWKNDTWINWRVREQTMRKEEFEVGNATQLRWWGLRGDGQILWYHVGGQKSTAAGVAQNRVAAYAGGSFGTQGTEWFKDDSVVKDIRVHAGYLASSDDVAPTLTPARPKNGHGWEAGAYAELQVTERAMLRPFASYFKRSDFSAARGDPLYSKLDDYTQAGLNVVWTLPAGLRAETGWTMQFGESQTNYTFQVNLVWGRGFNIPLGS